MRLNVVNLRWQWTGDSLKTCAFSGYELEALISLRRSKWVLEKRREGVASVDKFPTLKEAIEDAENWATRASASLKGEVLALEKRLNRRG